MRILFTGGGGAGTEALWELLRERHDVHFADADTERIHPVVPRDHAHAIPMADSDQFLPTTAALCKSLAIELLVPGVDEELESLAHGGDALGGTTLMSPHATYVATMLDKLDFAQSLEAAGLPVPATALLTESHLWRQFPCIAKPRRGRGSRGVRVIEDAPELAALRESLGDEADAFVVQQLMVGTEYSVQVMTDAAGYLRAVFPARILLKRGITLRAVGDPNASVIDACVALHARIPATGCYNVQGILIDDGIFVPFEINPRVSTTLCLAVASGLDPAEIFMGSRAGAGRADFESGIRLERYWTNQFRRTTDEIEA